MEVSFHLLTSGSCVQAVSFLLASCFLAHRSTEGRAFLQRRVKISHREESGRQSVGAVADIFNMLVLPIVLIGLSLLPRATCSGGTASHTTDEQVAADRLPAHDISK